MRILNAHRLTYHTFLSIFLHIIFIIYRFTLKLIGNRTVVTNSFLKFVNEDICSKRGKEKSQIFVRLYVDVKGPLFLRSSFESISRRFDQPRESLYKQHHSKNLRVKFTKHFVRAKQYPSV